VQPVLRELGDAAASAEHRPGLVIIATEDHYCGTPEMAVDVDKSVSGTGAGG
jgi:hypothetical protein